VLISSKKARDMCGCRHNRVQRARGKWIKTYPSWRAWWSWYHAFQQQP
jgi:hypothetical protein